MDTYLNTSSVRAGGARRSWLPSIWRKLPSSSAWRRTRKTLSSKKLSRAKLRPTASWQTNGPLTNLPPVNVLAPIRAAAQPTQQPQQKKDE